MPRSSGGGSHSGGSHHSSSHHSSGGSHSSGFHSSSSRSSYSSSYSRSYSAPLRSSRPVRPMPPPRVDHHYFPGASRYVYYRHHQPVYVYANESVKPKNKRHLWFIYGPILLVFIMTFVGMITPQKPMRHVRNDAPIVMDSAGVLGDSAELNLAMERFMSKTGIPPAVVTVNNETWQQYYKNLETYAYDCYVNLFSDERHWLIVYSQPVHPDPAFVNWYWQGMQGDDTVDLITSSVSDFFGETLQRGLTRNDISVTRALSDAFNNTAEVAMKPEVTSSSTILIDAVFIMVLLLIALCHTGTLGGKKKQATATTLPPDAKLTTVEEDKKPCAYCGGLYPASGLTCPHCGAARLQDQAQPAAQPVAQAMPRRMENKSL